MQTTFALAALAAVAFARPQGITENIAPKASAPEGCSPSYSGSFQIQAINFTQTAMAKRDTSCGSEGTLTINLNNGVLLDAQGRTGYIAENRQFQFDKPAQTGAIYTSGFSTCNNGSLALGGSAVFYQCLSGGFYNLYDSNWAPQCHAILLGILPCSGSSTTTPQVSQIGDGQVQASTAVPSPTKAPVSQIGDGQIQAPTAVPMPQAPVSQIADGQIQAPTAVPMPKAPAAPVSQIPDGQIQVTSAVPKPATATPNPVAQIPDGQIQARPSAASNATVAATPTPFTGAASSLKAGLSSLALAAAVVAFF